MIIETADIEQCKKVRQHFFIDDKDGSRRMKLGDKKLEISILTKSKTMRIFEAVPQNNIGNPQGKI
jgi:hypothetical protein